MNRFLRASPWRYSTHALPRYKSAPDAPSIFSSSIVVLVTIHEHFQDLARFTKPSITVAHFQEVDYRSEEVRSVASPGGFGRHGGGGGQQYVVKETFEEIDQVSRAGGRGHGRHGHRHGHGSGHFEARETKFEEDVNTGTGEFHERKDNFVVRAD